MLLWVKEEKAIWSPWCDTLPSLTTIRYNGLSLAITSAGSHPLSTLLKDHRDVAINEI